MTGATLFMFVLPCTFEYQYGRVLLVLFILAARNIREPVQ